MMTVVTDLGTLGAAVEALRHMPSNVEWRLKSERTVTIGDTEATFYTGSLPEAAFVDHTYRTERAVATELLSEIEPDDVVWDVGANYGFYACLASHEVESGDVVAFEPLDRNVDRLARNLSLSDVDPAVRELALGDEEARVPFDPPTFANTYRGVSRIAGETDGDAPEVQVQKGDALVLNDEVPSPTVVKIDVEGAEGLVLDGLDHVLSNGCRAVFCEIHPQLLSDFDTTERDVIDTFSEYGYEVTPLQERGDERHVKAVKRQ